MKHKLEDKQVVHTRSLKCVCAFPLNQSMRVRAADHHMLNCALNDSTLDIGFLLLALAFGC